MQTLKYLLAFVCGVVFGTSLAYIIFYLYPPCPTFSTCQSLPFYQSFSSQQEDSLPTTSSHIASVPILLYHYIEKGNNSLYVDPLEFEKQMNYLYLKGYQTISLADLFTNHAGKKFIITFDDGYKDIIENAFPILEKFEFKATVFPIVDYIGKEGYLNWDDLETLKNAGWTIGSHTLTHRNLLSLKPEVAEREIVLSKEKLESKLDIPVDFFCYPVGKFNKEIIEIVKKAGYKAAVTTLAGKHHTLLDIFKLKRIRISGSYNLETFIRIINE